MRKFLYIFITLMTVVFSCHSFIAKASPTLQSLHQMKYRENLDLAWSDSYWPVGLRGQAFRYALLERKKKEKVGKDDYLELEAFPLDPLQYVEQLRRVIVENKIEDLAYLSISEKLDLVFGNTDKLDELIDMFKSHRSSFETKREQKQDYRMLFLQGLTAQSDSRRFTYLLQQSLLANTISSASSPLAEELKRSYGQNDVSELTALVQKSDDKLDSLLDKLVAAKRPYRSLSVSYADEIIRAMKPVLPATAQSFEKFYDRISVFQKNTLWEGLCNASVYSSRMYPRPPKNAVKAKLVGKSTEIIFTPGDIRGLITRLACTAYNKAEYMRLAGNRCNQCEYYLTSKGLASPIVQCEKDNYFISCEKNKERLLGYELTSAMPESRGILTNLSSHETTPTQGLEWVSDDRYIKVHAIGKNSFVSDQNELYLLPQIFCFDMDQDDMFEQIYKNFDADPAFSRPTLDRERGFQVWNSLPLGAGFNYLPVTDKNGVLHEPGRPVPIGGIDDPWPLLSKKITHYAQGIIKLAYLKNNPFSSAPKRETVEKRFQLVSLYFDEKGEIIRAPSGGIYPSMNSPQRREAYSGQAMDFVWRLKARPKVGSDLKKLVDLLYACSTSTSINQTIDLAGEKMRMADCSIPAQLVGPNVNFQD